MMFTICPKVHRLLALESAPAQVLEVEVGLCRKTLVLSFWTMSDCTTEVVALVLAVAEVVHPVADCN